MAEDIIVRIKAEGAREFVKQLKEAGIQVETTGDKVQEMSKKTENSFGSLKKTIAGTFTAAFALEFIKGLSRIAVEVDATERKFRTVFGSASRQVEDFAKRNARALGLTTVEYKKAAAAAGDLLVPLGFQRGEAAQLSSQLVNLSGALSAWTGGQIKSTEVTNILTKALLGEREQLKSLGITISEVDVKNKLAEKGLSKLTGASLAQAKAAATLELITAKSIDAQDAFADGTQTLTEKQLVLKARFKEISTELAENLIPIYGRLLDVTNRILSGGEYKEILNGLSGASAIDLKNTREALELRRDELILLKKRGEISFKEAFELANKIPKALKEINRLEQERVGIVQGGRRGGGGIEAEEVVKRAKAEAEAAEAAKREADELERAKRAAAQIKREQEELQKVIERGVIEIMNDRFNGLEEFNESEYGFINNPLTIEGDDGLFDAALIAESEQVWSDLMKTMDDESDQFWNDFVKKNKEALDKEKAIQSARRGLFDQTYQTAFQIADSVFERQLNSLEEKNRLGAVSDEEYSRQRSEILRKQAIADKARAVFEIGVNTAIAITSALSQIGRGGLVLAGIAGAMGALQLASVIAQPIPQFAKGTKGRKKAPKGFAWVGEEGPELVQMKGGENVITAGDSERLSDLLSPYGIKTQYKAPSIPSLGDGIAQLISMRQLIPDDEARALFTGVDFSPLVRSSDMNRLTLGKKLDRIHHAIVASNNRPMTRA